MASKLDRELQRKILEELDCIFPKRSEEMLNNQQSEEEQDQVIANLLYLEQHGLVKSGIEWVGYGNEHYRWDGAEITAQGHDFMAGDGGLSAILGVVTVRLHDDTIRQMIEAKISQSELAPADKKKWTDGLRSLPADSIKHLTMELLTKGLEKAPDILQLLQRYITS
ncbi:hypothetical protein ACW4YW_15160 [Methylobacillus pratensis]